jgi:hypothetical protein
MKIVVVFFGSKNITSIFVVPKQKHWASKRGRFERKGRKQFFEIMK